MKKFFISSKKLFSFWDIQIFVFTSSPLFLPVSHCFRVWSKMNLKVYGIIINCLNKNLITHFVWHYFYFFFRTQSLLMDKIIKNKRGLELVTGHSSGYKTSSEKFLYKLYIIWPSLMIQYKVVFELFQKLHLQIYASQFMTLQIWKVWKGRGKIQKFKYLENEKSFLDEVKNIFHSFWSAIIWWKNKKLIKSSGQKL